MSEVKIDAEYPEAYRTNRHQAKFHPVARQLARNKSPEADADGNSRHQSADAGVAQPEQIVAITNHVLEVHRAEKPEVGNRQNGLQKRARGPNLMEIPQEFTGQVPAELFARSDGIHARNARGKSQPDERRADQHCDGTYGLAGNRSRRTPPATG